MLRDTRGLVQLDERFRDVPAYPGLRRFNNFSTVKQWTGVEQRAVSRQFIPVIAPGFRNTKRSWSVDTKRKASWPVAVDC